MSRFRCGSSALFGSADHTGRYLVISMVLAASAGCSRERSDVANMGSASAVVAPSPSASSEASVAKLPKEQSDRVLIRMKESTVTVGQAVDWLLREPRGMQVDLANEASRREFVDNFLSTELLAAEGRRRGVEASPAVERVKRRAMVEHMMRELLRLPALRDIETSAIDAYRSATPAASALPGDLIRHRIWRVQRDSAQRQFIERVRKASDVQINQAAFDKIRIDAKEKGDAARRSEVLATFKGGRVTAGELQDLVHQKSHRLQKHLADQAQLRRLVDDIVNYRLLVAEALRRGFDRDETVRTAVKEAVAREFASTEIDAKYPSSAAKESEVKAYIKAHPEVFDSVPQTIAKQMAAERIATERRNEAMAALIRSLREKYRPEVHADALKGLAIDIRRDRPRPAYPAGLELAPADPEAPAAIIVPDKDGLF